MNEVTMNRAKAEAKRFLDRVAEMEIQLKDRNLPWYGCPESGALRRASLDLTRALANLRRPG